MCADQLSFSSAFVGVNRRFRVFLGGLGVLAVRNRFPKPRFYNRRMKPLLALSAALLPATALAQIAPEDYTLLGAAVRTRPAYSGSKSQTVDLVPIVRYYGEPWFARTTQGILEGGVHWNVGSGVAAGFQLAYEEGRDASESAFLRERNFDDDVDPSGSVGAHLEWDTKIGPAPVFLLARYRQNVDVDRGALFDLRFNVGVYGDGRAIVALFTEATWGSGKANGTFYRVTPQQSAVSGFSVYEPGSGLRDVALGVIASYDLSRHWSLVGTLQARWLQGDVANSPLVERREAIYANAGVAYRF
jgi:outer membrane scaffolding protein for murein synthesis (MipA/OmpV family)